MTNEIQVSVVIPAFNAGKTVAQAIQSALEQQIAGSEILVIDDGSTDDTTKILATFVAQPAVRILHHPDHANRGTCASRRLALQHAQGEFVAFLDADDFFLPNKLARHVEILRAHRDVVLVHGAISARHEPGWDPAPVTRGFDLGAEPRTYDLTQEPDFLSANRICNSTIVCRRAAVTPNELPADMVFQFEDWVLLSSVALHGRFYYDPTPLTAYRVHEASFTHRHAQRSGARELAHLEYLATMMVRLPHGPLRKRAAHIFLEQAMCLVDKRASPDSRSGWPALQFLSALAKAVVPKYLNLALRFSKPWQWLSHTRRRD